MLPSSEEPRIPQDQDRAPFGPTRRPGVLIRQLLALHAQKDVTTISVRVLLLFRERTVYMGSVHDEARALLPSGR